jgi:energy-coupling factor transport system substrate-specific component
MHLDSLLTCGAVHRPPIARLWARRRLGWLTTLLASLIGLGAFFYPLFLSEVPAANGLAHATDSPILLGVLGALSLLTLILETQGGAASETKQVALLGVLVGLNAVLGFLETALPGPGGFSPVFFLIILGGYVYGGRFGFLLGGLTMFVAALITGGVGPWLPFRMLAGGWVGLTAPAVWRIVTWMRVRETRWEIVALAIFGSVWSLLFGALMNLWFWPFVGGPVAQPGSGYWEAGLSVAQGFGRFMTFYVATSLVWDMARLVGTAGMLLLFGRPTLRVLRRFARRFTFRVLSGEERA